MTKNVTWEPAYDVVVIGGGPGGSTLATFVAQQGHTVLLIERDVFPRYQIGESLLPSTVKGICRMLGVQDEMAQAGFTKKLGGTFRWGKNPEPWTFAFGSLASLANNETLAYQVERMKFDNILLTNAERKGVTVLKGCKVTGRLMDQDRTTGVTFVDADGQSHEVRAKFVADASGHQSVLAKHVGERVYSEFFQNVALFAYYTGGKRLPSPNQGNILSAAFRDGWFWYIPLSPTLTSVGVVLQHTQADRIKNDRESAMNSLIKDCPIISEYLSSAERVTEGVYGQFRIRKDYSYTSTNFWTKGLILLGDAACFVDPLFSQGVHLATYSALLVARSINSCLEEGADEAACLREYELRYRREYARFYDYLLALYDMNRDETSYFWEARKILNTTERANDAFIRLIAGLATGDPVLCAADEYFEGRERVGELFQDAVDNGRGQFVPFKSTTQVTGTDLFSESAKVVELGSGAASAEAPLMPGGLVPSMDGLHWAIA